MKAFREIVWAVALASASNVVVGCAPRAEMRAAAPPRTYVEVAAAMPGEAVTASDPVGGDALPPAAAALLDVERGSELVAARRLREHVPSALSFHCVSGEESLACAARPVTTTEGESQ